MRPNRTTKARARQLLLVGAILPATLALTAQPAAASQPASATSSSQTLDVRVSQGSDDVEEQTDGRMYTNSSDLEMVDDPGQVTALRRQVVGIRFAAVNIPADATITAAYLEFKVDKDTASEPTSLLIRGERSAKSKTFTGEAGNVRSRAQTKAFAQWNSVEPWTTQGQAKRSVDLSAIVGEVITQPGWTKGSPVTFLIDGYGRRVAKSFENSASEAPLLHIEYTAPTPGPDPQPEPGTAVSQVQDSRDDVEERPGGQMYVNSSDLELVTDGSLVQKVGLRFAKVDVPKGAKIDSAYIEFVADADQRDVAKDPTSLMIQGEASANSARFSTSNGDVSKRKLTKASVKWPSVEPWMTPLEKHRSVDVAPVVQEVVGQQGWAQGNPVTLVITGSGRRNARSFDDSASQAARLVIKYSAGTTPVEPTLPPVKNEQIINSGTATNTALTGKDWSGLVYQQVSASRPAGLWAVNNGNSLLHFIPEGATKPTTTHTMTPGGATIDAEAVTIGGDGGLFVAGEGSGGAQNAVYEFNVSNGVNLMNTWNFGKAGENSPIFPGKDPNDPNSVDHKAQNNKGIEALAWVPRSALGQVGTSYRRDDSLAGFVAIGTETQSTIYFVALLRGNPAQYEVVATADTGLKGVMGLEWDGQELWAYCDNACGKSPAGGEPAAHVAIFKQTPQMLELAGRWPTAPELEEVTLEGFALKPFDSCRAGGNRQAWWVADAATTASLYVGSVKRCGKQ